MFQGIHIVIMHKKQPLNTFTAIEEISEKDKSGKLFPENKNFTKFRLK